MRPAILWGALGVSLLLHASWAWRSPRDAGQPGHRSSAEESVELSLVELADSTAAQGAAPLQASSAVTEPAAVQRDPRSRIEPKRRPLAEPAPELAAVPQSSTATGTPADQEARALAPTAVPADRGAPPASAGGVTAANDPARAAATAVNGLSPSAAAATLADEVFAAPRQNACRSAFPSGTPRCDEVAPSAEQRLQRSLDDAATRIPHLAGRPPPALKRDANGDYHYDGRVFSALIRRDGSVSLTDRSVVQSAPIPIGGTFDLMDAVEKHVLGKELYAAEKRWFLEHTAELRRTLGGEAHAARLAQGSLHLRGRLEAILRDRALPDARKRALVFELWDDCAPDGIGEQAQHIVERFIRDHMPPGSPLAYDPAELARLNHGRASVRAFDPYAPVDAGTPG